MTTPPKNRSLRELLDAQSPAERAAAVARFDERMAEGQRAHEANLIAARVTMLVPGPRPGTDDRSRDGAIRDGAVDEPGGDSGA